MDSDGPGHICGTDIAAAVPGDISARDKPGDEFAKGDGPQDKGSKEV
jgi:hypothetical protein